MSSHDKVETLNSWFLKGLKHSGTVAYRLESVWNCIWLLHTDVIVSIAAFVMGMDVSNVDVVVRIGCPPYLEEKFK